MTFVSVVVQSGTDAKEAERGLERMLEAQAAYPGGYTQRTSATASGRVFAGAARVQEGSDSCLHEDPATGVTVIADLLLESPAALARSLGGRRAPSDADGPGLVARGYLKWPRRAAEHVVGDGVVAVWDPRELRLSCWRDVSGVRPLYYFYDASDRTLVVSSDLRGLVAHPSVPQRLDLEVIRAMLEYGQDFAHQSRTPCAGVYKLPAAHALEFDPRGLRIRPYWRATEVEPRLEADMATYAEEVREVVRASVARRAEGGEGPIGSHLSGGLDSSSLTAFAAREGRRVVAYSWAPSWQRLGPIESDERPLAEAVAFASGAELHYTDLEVRHLLEVATRNSAVDPSTTLQAEVSVGRSAVELGCRTLLSGWGGDELIVFNGRGYFADLARRGRLATVQRELKARTSLHDTSVASGWRGRVLKPLLPEAVGQLLGAPSVGHRGVWPSELRPEFLAALRDVDPVEPVGLRRERPGVRRTQVSLLTDGHLQYRAESWAAFGARAGLVYRFPLLSRPVVELALSLPDHVYFRDGWKRWLYREAMAGVLPDEVRWHPHKQDNALAEQVRRLRPHFVEAFQAQLAERADNPFVRVDQLARTAAQDPGAAGEADGTAAWLAFIDWGIA